MSTTPARTPPAVIGVTGVVAGNGIVYTPNPIVRTGTVSLSPTVTAAITETAKVQHIEADESTTRVSSGRLHGRPIHCH